MIKTAHQLVNKTARFFSAVLLGFIFIQSAFAASHTWSGATSGNWSVAGNWSSGGVPVTGEANLVLIFPGSPSRYVTTNNISSLTVQSIQLNGNGYHLYGNSITMSVTPSGTNISIPPAGIGSFMHLPIVTSAGAFGVAVGDSAKLEIQGVISGAGELNKYGGGLLRLNGANGNSFTGGFRQHEGLVALGKTLGAALGGPVYVGHSNSTATITLSYEWHHQIPDASEVRILGEKSSLMLEGYNDTIGVLKLIGGQVETVNGSNFQVGELQINGDVTADDSSTPNLIEPGINGQLNLGNVQRVFNVPSSRRLIVWAHIASTGTNGGITLTGGGNLQFNSSNSFAGPLLVKMGDVLVSNSGGFGSTNGPTILDGGGLGLYSGSFVSGESLEVKQSTHLITAATNAWNGPILIQTNAQLSINGSLVGGYDWLTLGGAITGPGKLSYLIDRVDLLGSTPNTLSGGHRVRGYTFMVLAKSTTNALSGPITLEGAFDSVPTLFWSVNNQISDSSSLQWISYITPTNTGGLNLNNHTDVVGSISGDTQAYIDCGLGKLTVGANDLNSDYAGTITGGGSNGGTNLVKIGAGTLLLSGNPSMFGKTIVSGGSLILSNAVGMGPVHVESGGRLAGSGYLATLTAAGSGSITPGPQLTPSSYSALKPSSFNLGGGYLSMALAGTNAGVDYDQIVTYGPLNLNGVGLQLSALTLPHGSNSFTLINVQYAGAVSGNFTGLPEGAIFPSSDGKSFQITYHGGDGNDVVVTRYYTKPIAAQLGGIGRLPDGRMRLTGTGLVDALYQVQANTTLNNTNWVAIGSVSASDEFGALEFVDNNAPNFPMRFYRFVLP